MADNSAEMDGGFDLDAALREGLNEIQTNEPAEPVEPVEPAAPAEPAEPTEEPVRARGPDGKFARKQDVEPAEPVQPVESAAEPAEDVRRVANRLGLRREEMDAFAKADPVLREAFQRRSDEWHQSMQQIRPLADFGQSLYAAIQPFEATIRASGRSHAEAVAGLLTADHTLRYGTPAEKTNMMLAIARDYAVDLRQAAQFAMQGQQAYVDPSIAEARRIAEQVRHDRERIESMNQLRERQELSNEMTAFRSKPEHKHFEQVRHVMADLIEAGKARSFVEAYEQAVWLEPSVRTELIAEQQRSADAQRQADTARKTQAARRASQINVPKRGSIDTTAEPKGTWEESLNSYYEQMNS